MDGTSAVAADLLSQYGYVGLGLTLLVNCMGIPIPSEVTLPLAGIGAQAGRLNLAIVVAVAMAAQIAGLMIAYIVARHGGLRLIERFGHYVFIQRRQITAAQRMFKREGRLIVLVGLLLPGVHGYMGYPAGLARMNIWLFASLAFIGSAVWTAVLVAAGYFAGGHLDAIERVFTSAGLIAMLVLAALAAGFWYSRRHKPRSKARS